MIKTQFYLASCLLVTVLAGNTLAEAGVEFFDRRIRPLLALHCYECHGPDKQENHLRLDRAEELFAGDASGRPLYQPNRIVVC